MPWYSAECIIVTCPNEPASFQITTTVIPANSRYYVLAYKLLYCKTHVDSWHFNGTKIYHNSNDCITSIQKHLLIRQLSFQSKATSIFWNMCFLILINTIMTIMMVMILIMVIRMKRTMTWTSRGIGSSSINTKDYHSEDYVLNVLA